MNELGILAFLSFIALHLALFCPVDLRSLCAGRWFIN